MSNQPLKILYLSQYFPPEMGAPSARVFELSRRWVQQCAEVTVLTSFPNHPTGIIPVEYQGYKFLEEEKEGIKIIRTYIYPAPNKGFFKRILSYMSFMFSSVIQGTSKIGKQDLIIATSPQFFVGVAGYVISRLKKIPFVFEIRDLWPESIVQLGQLKNKSVIKFLEWIELFLYRQAIHIVAVADSSRNVLTGRGIPDSKISVIKNGVDLSLFRLSGNQDTLKCKLGLENNFVVSYIGTLGLSHALDKVLETAKELQDKKEVIFLLVGEGAEKSKLKKLAQKWDLQNVQFLDQIGKDDLPGYYELSDVVLVTLRDLPLFRKVIPSKIFEIMAMSRPIIISVDGEAHALVDGADAGVFCQPEDPKMLKEAIEKLMADEEYRLKLGQNGRKFVEDYFNRDKLADNYLALIEDLFR